MQPRNLLDNSDFLHFIAQAGIGGTHGTQAYAGDRWKLTSGTVAANASGGIALNGTIVQVVANPPTTGSAFVATVSGTATIAYSAGAVTITSAGGVLKNAVLYEGAFTADTLPPYVYKGYAAELMECQRYAIIAGLRASGYVDAGTSMCHLHIPIPILMRTIPSLVPYNLNGVVVSNGVYSLTSASVVAMQANGIYVDAVAETTFTAFEPCCAYNFIVGIFSDL